MTGDRSRTLMAAAIILGAFIVDWRAPADVNVGVLYALALIIVGTGRSIKPLVALSAVALLFLALAVVLGPPGTQTRTLEVVWINRLLTGGTVVIAAVLAVLLGRRTASLVEAKNLLARRLEEGEGHLAKVERARTEAEARLRHASQLETLGRLTSNVAHDFRNLLCAVVGNLDLLRRQVPGEPSLLRRLTGAELAARKACDQADRLLALSRRRKPIREQVEVQQVLDGVADILRQAIGCDISLSIDAPRGLTAWTDRNQLELALLNLCINARDALLSQGEIAISVEKTVNARTGRGFAVIHVRDNGCGMDEATRARACEPFYSTKPEGLGTGLGLAMVRELAEWSAGRLEIKSASGAGTCVSIWLAIDEPAMTRQWPPAAGTHGGLSCSIA